MNHNGKVVLVTLCQHPAGLYTRGVLAGRKWLRAAESRKRLVQKSRSCRKEAIRQCDLPYIEAVSISVQYDVTGGCHSLSRCAQLSLGGAFAHNADESLQGTKTPDFSLNFQPHPPPHFERHHRRRLRPGYYRHTSSLQSPHDTQSQTTNMDSASQ